MTAPTGALDAARARHLDAMHAVVAAACVYVYTHTPLTGYGGQELETALRDEAKAANAVTAVIRKQARLGAQPSLLAEGDTTP